MLQKMWTGRLGPLRVAELAVVIMPVLGVDTGDLAVVAIAPHLGRYMGLGRLQIAQN